MTNDNVIQFPTREELGEMDEFEQGWYEHQKLVDAVGTMLDVHAQGIVNSSEDVDWGHMMDAMLHLTYVCGIRSGMSESIVSELIQTSKMIEVEFDE